ncbi:MAG: phosphoglucosamine mutase, partial [Planctomycetes bacterium]|nr:phosphoglucosamine mutase [Planctomycetota bacterium]
PEPLKENLVELAKATATAQAACGFAQDPDADRLAIVDEHGTYIGEEYTLVLAAKRVLELQGGGVIATNLSTSRMIDDVAAQYPGASVLRTAVGEANVVAAMRSEDAVIGGEGNGGVIFPPVCFVRDSLSAMALVLSLLAAEKRSLSDLVSELPHYEMIKQKFDLSAVGGRDAVGSMIQKVTEAFADEKINTSDGIRVDFTEGWVHLRPSNTEPIVRLIAEAETQEAAAGLMHKVGSVAGLG